MDDLFERPLIKLTKFRKQSYLLAYQMCHTLGTNEDDLILLSCFDGNRKALQKFLQTLEVPDELLNA